MSYNKSKLPFNFIDAGKKVIAIEQKGLEQLNQYINEDFCDACNTILNCTGKIIVMGIGKSGHIARKIASTLASTGTASFFIHPSEANHGDLGMISAQDIVIALSNSGESCEILTLIPIFKRFNIILICITGNPKSTMGKSATIHLCIHVSKEACPLGLSPTASTTAALVMGDALAVSLLQARGFTTEDFALSHPGGFLGKKLLLRVDDIMHTGKDIPLVYNTSSLNDAIIEINIKNMGMTVICDYKNNIVGIFTDGDLRRIYSTNIDPKKVNISDVMTHKGIRIKPGTLAIEALNIMQEHKITSLLVSKNNDLIGVIHMHDMLHAGVM